MFALNATYAQYRAFSAHLEKGLPRLVGNDNDAVRVRWAEKPRRKTNGLGKEFVAVVDQGQTSDISDAIRLVETAWFANITDQVSAAPKIAKYMYSGEEQKRRTWPACTHTRDRCDAPPVPNTAPRLHPFRARENDNASHPTAPINAHG